MGRARIRGQHARSRDKRRSAFPSPARAGSTRGSLSHIVEGESAPVEGAYFRHFEEPVSRLASFSHIGGNSMFKEFREFIARGSVIDMAIGIIIGAAFGKIIASLVADLIMPPIGMLLGGVDFTNLFITLSGGAYPTLAEAKEAG